VVVGLCRHFQKFGVAFADRGLGNIGKAEIAATPTAETNVFRNVSDSSPS
jgi:hypothetical protein